jgi:hypothetical protein
MGDSVLRPAGQAQGDFAAHAHAHNGARRDGEAVQRGLCFVQTFGQGIGQQGTALPMAGKVDGGTGAASCRKGLPQWPLALAVPLPGPVQHQCMDGLAGRAAQNIGRQRFRARRQG